MLLHRGQGRRRDRTNPSDCVGAMASQPSSKLATRCSRAWSPVVAFIHGIYTLWALKTGKASSRLLTLLGISYIIIIMLLISAVFWGGQKLAKEFVIHELVGGLVAEIDTTVPTRLLSQPLPQNACFRLRVFVGDWSLYEPRPGATSSLQMGGGTAATTTFQAAEPTLPVKL